MAGKLVTVTLNVVADFGDWVDIEKFNWGAYSDALTASVRADLVDPEAHVVVNFVQTGAGILFDGVKPLYDDLLFETIVDAVDATDARFYTA